MILVWIIAIIGLLWLFAYYGNKYCNTEAYQNKLLSTEGTYLGGSSQIYDAGFKAIVMVSQKEFIISPMLFQSSSDNIKIPIEKIKVAMIKSEQELRHKMTAGRIILFGIFAKPKEYKTTNKFLYVDYYNDENELETIVVQCNQAQYIVERIHYHKNKLENQNKNQSVEV